MPDQHAILATVTLTVPENLVRGWDAEHRKIVRQWLHDTLVKPPLAPLPQPTVPQVLRGVKISTTVEILAHQPSKDN